MGHVLYDLKSNEDSAIHDAQEEFQEYRSSYDVKTWLMLAMITMTIPIVHFLPEYSRPFPSSLVRIIMCTNFEQLIFRMVSREQTPTAGGLALISGSPPVFHVPDATVNSLFLSLAMPTSLSLEGVGLIESI
jgi:MFS superfamily sulfate permease-like transporter